MHTIITNTHFTEPTSEFAVQRLRFAQCVEALLPILPLPSRLACREDYLLATDFALHNLKDNNDVAVVLNTFASHAKASQYLSDTVEELAERSVTASALRSTAAKFPYEKSILLALALILEQTMLKIAEASGNRQTLTAPQAVIALENEATKTAPQFAANLKAFLGTIEIHQHEFLEPWEQAFSALLASHGGATQVCINTPSPNIEAVKLGSRLKFEKWNAIEGELASCIQWIANQAHLAHSKQIAVPQIAVLGKREFVTLAANEFSRVAPHIPYVLACGRPATDFAEGSRILLLLECIATALPMEKTCSLLAFIADPSETKHSRGWWIEQANSCYILDPETPTQATISDWFRLSTKNNHAQTFKDAIETLVNTATAALENEPLPTIVDHIANLLEKHFAKLNPPKGIFESFIARARALARSPMASGVRGPDAIETLQHIVQNFTVSDGKLRGAFVYFGTVTGALGCAFDSIFVGNVKEGVFPSSVREDPLLPDHVRQTLQLLQSRNRTFREKHSLGAVLSRLRDSATIAWSYQDAGAHEREHSGLVIDLFSAARSITVDIESHLDTEASASAASILQDRLQNPINPGDVVTNAILQGKKSNTITLPQQWPAGIQSGPAFTMGEASSMCANLKNDAKLSVADGALATQAASNLMLHGQSPEKPISPTVLSEILSCPLRYMLKQLLKWDDAPCAHEAKLEAPEIGILIHECAQKIYENTTPSAFFALSTSDQKKLISTLVDAVIKGYANDLMRYIRHGSEQQTLRARLVSAVTAIVEFDKTMQLSTSPQTEIAVCGEVSYKTHKSIHIRGRVDRILVDASGTWSVVDFKSGRNRQTVPLQPFYDIQLVAYTLLAALPVAQGGYGFDIQKLNAVGFVYPEDHGKPERWFVGADKDNLIAEGKKWLETASTIVQNKQFLRTTDRENCKYCSFIETCTDEMFLNSLRKIMNTQSAQVKSIASLWSAAQGATP